MKTGVKRILAAILSLVMVATLLPFGYVNGQKAEAAKKKDMYTVLVINNSGDFQFTEDGETVIYTAETALPQVKKGAVAFLKALKKANSVVGANVYVSIISYDQLVYPVTKNMAFTDDIDDAIARVEKVKVSKYFDGGNFMGGALKVATARLKSVKDEDVVKNTVLFSNGMASSGIYKSSGKYDECTVGSSWCWSATNVPIWKYGNYAVAEAENLKKQGKVYSIGLFDNFEGMPSEGKDIQKLFKTISKDVASPKRFISVTDAKKLVSKFKSVAQSLISEWKQA